jgi:hypothetical protein
MSYCKGDFFEKGHEVSVTILVGASFSQLSLVLYRCSFVPLDFRICFFFSSSSSSQFIGPPCIVE